jgi:hypothetical protein
MSEMTSDLRALVAAILLAVVGKGSVAEALFLGICLFGG